MSDLNLNKNTTFQDEDENSNSNEQKNPNTTVDMDVVKEKETTKQGEIKISESKNFMCIDIENSLTPPAEKNDILVDEGQLIDTTQLKIHVISQIPGKRKYTVLGLYDYVFPPAQQQPYQNSRNTRQVWRQDPPPPQPQQTMWTQYGPGQGQGYGGDGRYDGYGYDERGPLLYDPRARNSFVALVMGLVFAMLVATAGFLGYVLATPDMKEFFQSVGWSILLPALLGLCMVNCAMICSPCARRPPCNFVCLILTTASMSIIAAKITSHYRTEVILYAVLATGVVVFVCIILACSSFDFTSYMLYVICIATAFSVIVMIILVTMMLTGTMLKPLIIVLLVVGTLIQVVMLTMQLQMILGGRTIEMSEADYALAAFLIYTSILDIFLKLVHILGLAGQG